MLNVCCKSLIAFIVLFVLLQSAHAQPIVARADSIESMVINADLVFVARLVKIGDAQKVEGRDVYSTTIDVEQNLKREIFNDDPYDRVQADISRDLSVLNDWLEHSSRLLILYDQNSPYQTNVIELVPGKMEVMQADFSLLREPDEVIRAIKEALKHWSPAIRRIHTFGLYVPRNRIVGTQWEKYHGLILNVPVNQELEERAIEFTRSENYLEREQGVRALRYFKSDENIARLKAFLEDSGWAYLQHAEQNNGIEVRFYGIREAAYNTLKYWGVDAQKPVTREEVRLPAGDDPVK
ncbi:MULTISPECIES: hypothetical protein [Pirellulaceae]|nr:MULTISPECIES: hypothetical protein [Pirellulaceae]